MLCQFTFLTKTGATGKNHPPAASLKTNCNTKCVIEYTSLSAGIKRKALVIIALMSIGRCISYYNMTPLLTSCFQSCASNVFIGFDLINSF